METIFTVQQLAKSTVNIKGPLQDSQRMGAEYLKKNSSFGPFFVKIRQGLTSFFSWYMLIFKEIESLGT